MVMSCDAGPKLIVRVSRPHGPYLLLRVTKGGMCELDRDPNKHGSRMVKPSLVSWPNIYKECGVCGHRDALGVLKCDECGYDFPEANAGGMARELAALEPESTNQLDG